MDCRTIRLSAFYPHIPNDLLLDCSEFFKIRQLQTIVRGDFKKDTPILLLDLKNLGQQATAQAQA
jgi:hypothetical protein